MALTVKNTGGGNSVFPKQLTITTQPTKVDYKDGETLDLTGLVTTVSYSDGHSEVVQCTANPVNGTILYESVKKVTLSWIWDEDTDIILSVDLPITVTRVLESIFVTTPTKTTYYKGDTLDLSGAKVTATFTSKITEDVTSKASFSPTNGVALNSYGIQTITASYAENGVTKTATTSITVSVKTVTWSGGTDEEIVNMVDAADAGVIKLSDYWTVGDTRKINLSAMSATGVGESHAAQTAEFVLMNVGGKKLSNDKECNFVVGMKNCLNEEGYMNSSNTSTTGWDKCARRTWCNSVFYNAIPSSIRGIFKKCKNVTASTGGNLTASLTTSEDYFALPAEKEIFGDGYGYSKSGYAADSEANSSALTQFTWYKTSSNRVKTTNGSANRWWERSPYGNGSGYFCYVYYDGSASDSYASDARGLAPFGCI